MSPSLKIAIEALYETFKEYRLNAVIPGCPCCVSDEDKSILHSKKLTELTGEDLSRYTFKAMITWGGVQEFKHFLPRILELKSNKSLMIDLFIINGKLDHSHWKEWGAAEQASIKHFFRVWWNHEINDVPEIDFEILVEGHKILGDLAALLEVWDLSFDSEGFKNYIKFIEYHYSDLKRNKTSFESFNSAEWQTLIDWIAANAAKLEEGFFKFEKVDPTFSKRISDALYIL